MNALTKQLLALATRYQHRRDNLTYMGIVELAAQVEEARKDAPPDAGHPPLTANELEIILEMWRGMTPNQNTIVRVVEDIISVDVFVDGILHESVVVRVAGLRTTHESAVSYANDVLALFVTAYRTPDAPCKYPYRPPVLCVHPTQHRPLHAPSLPPKQVAAAHLRTITGLRPVDAAHITYAAIMLEQPPRAVLDGATMRHILDMTRAPQAIRELVVFIREHRFKYIIDINAYYRETEYGDARVEHVAILDALDTPEIAHLLAEDIKTLIYANRGTHVGVIVRIHQF